MGMNREATRNPPAPGVGGIGPWVQLASAAIKYLKEIRDFLSVTPSSVAFGGASVQERLDNWPIAGQRRVIVQNRASGGLITVSAGGTGALDLLPQDPGRGGVQLVNYGANPTFVYLCRAGDQSNGAPVLWVSGNGGAWDGKIGGELWCGPVSVESPLGTNLTLAVI